MLARDVMSDGVVSVAQREAANICSNSFVISGSVDGSRVRPITGNEIKETLIARVHKAAEPRNHPALRLT